MTHDNLKMRSELNTSPPRFPVAAEKTIPRPVSLARGAHAGLVSPVSTSKTLLREKPDPAPSFPQPHHKLHHLPMLKGVFSERLEVTEFAAFLNSHFSQRNIPVAQALQISGLTSKGLGHSIHVGIATARQLFSLDSDGMGW